VFGGTDDLADARTADRQGIGSLVQEDHHGR
jgi:hypothetical protein